LGRVDGSAEVGHTMKGIGQQEGETRRQFAARRTHEMGAWQRRAETAEARVTELKTALRQIGKFGNVWSKEHARKALEEGEREDCQDVD